MESQKEKPGFQFQQFGENKGSPTPSWKRGVLAAIGCLVLIGACLPVIYYHLKLVKQDEVEENRNPHPTSSSSNELFPTTNGPAQLLESLSKGAVIKGHVYEAWKAVRDSPLQHICKSDLHVDSSGSNIVVEKFHLHKLYREDPPYVVKGSVDYVVPSGYELTGAIVINHWIDGTGGWCSLRTTGNRTEGFVMSRMMRGFSNYVLIIGKQLR